MHTPADMPALAFVLLLVLGRQPAPALPYQDLVPEFVEKIAAAVAPLQRVYLVVTARDDDTAAVAGGEDTRAPALEARVAGMLAARGIRAANRADGVASVTFTCSQNLRERACVADVRKGDDSQLVVVSRRHDPGAAVPRPAPLALDVRTVFTQRAPMLDVALVGDRLVVLEPTAVTLYQRRQSGWQLERSRPIASSRAPARDVRGRLHVDGTTVDVWLPGVICRANLEALNLTCADEQQPWPIGVENTGISAGRNYFTTPEGLAFFSAASLGSGNNVDNAAERGDVRWLLTAQNGALLVLDASRRTIESRASMGDDVAAVSVSGAGCPAGPYVILSSRAGASGPDDAEALRLFQVVGRRLVAVAPPVVLPGPLSALWAEPGSTTATAVSHDTSSGRYEAFQVAITCGR